MSKTTVSGPELKDQRIKVSNNVYELNIKEEHGWTTIRPVLYSDSGNKKWIIYEDDFDDISDHIITCAKAIKGNLCISFTAMNFEVNGAMPMGLEKFKILRNRLNNILPFMTEIEIDLIAANGIDTSKEENMSGIKCSKFSIPYYGSTITLSDTLRYQLQTTIKNNVAHIALVHPESDKSNSKFLLPQEHFDDIKECIIKYAKTIKKELSIDFTGVYFDVTDGTKIVDQFALLFNELAQKSIGVQINTQDIYFDQSSVPYDREDLLISDFDILKFKNNHYSTYNSYNYDELIVRLRQVNTGLHAVRTILAGVKTYQDPNMDNRLRLFTGVVRAFAIGMYYYFKRHTMLGKLMMLAPVVYEFYKIIKYQIYNKSSEDTTRAHWFEVITLSILSNLAMTEILYMFVKNSKYKVVVECVFTAANFFFTGQELFSYLLSDSIESGLQISESNIEVICDAQEDGVCIKNIDKAIDRDGVEKVNLCKVEKSLLLGISNITKLHDLCSSNDNEIENGCKYTSESSAENGDKIIGVIYGFLDEFGNCTEIGE